VVSVEEWREDCFYYLVSSLMVQVLTFLTFAPAKSLWLLSDGAGTSTGGCGDCLHRA